MDDRARLPVSAQDGRRQGEGTTGNVVWSKRFLDYSISNLKMIGGTIVAYYPVHEDVTEHAIEPYFMVCGGLVFFALLADLALIYLLLPGRNRESPFVATKILTYITSVLMMLTSVSLLLLLNPRYAVVTVLALPAIAIVSIVFYKGTNTGQDREFTDYEAHKSELKQFFDLSALLTVTAFGGMVAIIFGYFKNAPKDVHQVDVKFSETLIFVTVISGHLVMLLTTAPASLPHPNAGSLFLNFVKALSYSLFGLLTLTGLAVAAEFLEVFILLALILIFYLVVVWLSMEFNQEDGTSQARSATDHESVLDASSTITIVMFASLMGIYSAYFGSEKDDSYLQTCMFFMFLAFMSSLCSTLLAFRRRRTQRLAMVVRKLITCSTICSLVFAMLGLFFLAIRTG